MSLCVVGVLVCVHCMRSSVYVWACLCAGARVCAVCHCVCAYVREHTVRVCIGDASYSPRNSMSAHNM